MTHDPLLALRQNFPLYARKCLRIRAKDGRIVPLVLNRAQSYIHEQLEGQLSATGMIRALLLKGRQQGASTYTEGRLYWRTSGALGKRAYILTHEDKATANLFEMAKRFHDNCPEVVRPHTGASSSKELLFDKLDSGYLVATAGTRNTGRSSTIQYFHGSEVAFWPNAEEHMAGIGQSLPNERGTESILESTANGVGNLFHGMWQDAQRGVGLYIPVFVPWFWQTEYTMAPPEGWAPSAADEEYRVRYGLTPGQAYWRRQKLDTEFRGDVELFNQEYPATPALAFSKSEGNPLIPLALLEPARKATAEPIGRKVMGLDPAEYGDDDSAIAIRVGRAVTRIMRRHGLSPMEVVGWAARVIEDERPDFINVDGTGIGAGIVDRLIELGYPAARIMFGARATQEEQYVLRRDEMWGDMLKWFQDGPVSIPDDDALVTDLAGPTYTHDSSRRLKLERKEDMKKRGMRSPDAGDAVALTFAAPLASASGRRLNHNREFRE